MPTPKHTTPTPIPITQDYEKEHAPPPTESTPIQRSQWLQEVRDTHFAHQNPQLASQKMLYMLY